MPSDLVELTKQIKAANDIVQVVGSYLTLRPAGAVFKALCPFHNDSRPSLDIDPRRQRYRCWSCGKHGDVITFVEEMEKVGFKEARQILATRAGIKLDETPNPQDQLRSRLFAITHWAQARYHECLLNDPSAEPARAYLGSRRLSGKTVRDFGLGFAPLAGDWLVQLAETDHISTEELVEVGLIAPRPEGRGYYDRFRDRIMFPIRDVQKRPVGFGGRILPESPYASRAPKYYNSAETPLFAKSELLYGLELARHAGAAEGYLAVVEGYTDVMMAHQCGIPQVVATMGTALNSRHVAHLRRYVPRVVLVYDADAGGLTGVDRALELFVAHDLELAIATLPDGLDPCDLLVRPDGVAAFKQVLARAVDALEFKLNRLLERNAQPSVEVTRRIIDEVLGIMAAAPPHPSQYAQVKHELIVTRLAHRLGLRQETVWTRLGELKRERQSRDRKPPAREPAPDVMPAAARTTHPGGQPPTPKNDARFACELQLLDLLLAHPLLVGQAERTIAPEDLSHTGLRRVLFELYAIHAAGDTPDMDLLRERLDDRPDLFEVAGRRRFVGQHMQDPEDWLERILKRFDEMKVEAEKKSVAERLKTADDAEAKELLRRLQQSRPA